MICHTKTPPDVGYTASRGVLFMVTGMLRQRGVCKMDVSKQGERCYTIILLIQECPVPGKSGGHFVVADRQPV